MHARIVRRAYYRYYTHTYRSTGLSEKLGKSGSDCRRVLSFIFTFFFFFLYLVIAFCRREIRSSDGLIPTTTTFTRGVVQPLRSTAQGDVRGRKLRYTSTRERRTCAAERKRFSVHRNNKTMCIHPLQVYLYYTFFFVYTYLFF